MMNRIAKSVATLGALMYSVFVSYGLAMAAETKPSILVIWGDDIGQTNINAYTFGVVGYRTPNIDRIAKEGMMFTDYYGDQSCTAGRSSFIIGQSVFRTGLSKVGPDGELKGLNLPNGASQGRWRVSDNGVLCVEWQTTDGSIENCDVLTFFSPEIGYQWGGNTLVLLEGNPKDL